MKKQIFKMISICIVVMMLITAMIPLSAFATSNTSSKTGSYIQDGYYRIQHVSGKYVDVSEVSMKNGAILHIWDKAEGYQNQIFKISRNPNGTYTIIANHSQKCIEVRNSSMEDYAEVAQWDYAGIPCQQWYISKNKNGSFSFRNANSGLNLNVKENKSENGTPLIQYHSDNTSAEQFNLIRMKESDISSALFETNPKEFNYDSIKYTPIIYSIENEFLKMDFKSKGVNNLTYNKYGNLYFPSCNKPSLYQVIYLDFKTVNAMICNYKTNPSLAEEIADFVIGNGESWALDEIIPFSSNITDFFSILAEAEDKKEWNRFISEGKKAIDNYNGLCVRVYLNTKIQKRNVLDYEGVNAGISEETVYTAHLDYKYSFWDGISDIGNPIDGSSTYQYKNFDKTKLEITPKNTSDIRNSLTSTNIKSKFEGEWTYCFK